MRWGGGGEIENMSVAPDSIDDGSKRMTDRRDNIKSEIL